MIIYLFDDWGAFCSQSIIFKTLKTHRIFRKIIQKKALKRSKMCRNASMMNISELLDSQRQLYFWNESAVNEHTCHRKHDWFSFDIISQVILLVKRFKRWNILFCYDLNNIFAYHIHQRIIDESRFEWILENHILLQCNSYSGLKFVLMMNNASIHHHSMSFSNFHLFW